MDHTEITVFLSLGSNLGDRAGLISRACELIEKEVGVVKKRSSISETEPWGMKEVPLFLNQVIEVISVLSPFKLLEVLQEIEKKLGRSRIPNARSSSLAPHPSSFLSRPIDIDILFYGEEVLETPELTIPHPLLQDRRFVLVPLAEIAKELIHPVSGKSMESLLASCSDSREVKAI